MKSYEKRMLIGLYFIVISIFISWYNLHSTYNLPGESRNINVPGYTTVPGIVILIAALIMAAFIFIPWSKQTRERIFYAHLFLAALIGFLVFTGAIIPLFSFRVQNPRLGVAGLLIGCVLIALALKKGSESLQ